MSERFEVRKYGHAVPVASGTCENCGRPVRYNLAAPIAIHVGGGEPNDCRDPWPAANIEAAQIDGEPLEVAGTSASTNEASTPRSVESVSRVDGSDASVRLPPEPPPLSVVLLRQPDSHPSGVVYRRYGPRSQREGWCPPGALLNTTPLTWAELNDLGKVTPLVERSAILREYADRWHYVDDTRWPMSTFGAAPTPYCACGKTWPEGGCTERRNLIADAATPLPPVSEVTPLVEHTSAFERGIRADELRGAARDMLDRHYELGYVRIRTVAGWLQVRAGALTAGEVSRG